MNYLSDNKLEFLKDKISNAQKITITCHINPDGDCIGASLALFGFLLKYKKFQLNILLPNDFPDFLRFLKNSEKPIIFEKENLEHQNMILDADILFSVDYNEPKRTGNLAEFIEKSSAFKIMIDHHISPLDFCDITISDIKSSSASEIMYNFLCQIDENKIDKDIAEAILTGIVMDTGVFNFNSSNPETFMAVAEILKTGADKNKIIHNIYNTSSENRLRMMGYVISEKMKIFSDKKTALLSLTKKELEKFDYKIGDTEGFVNIPLSLNGINFSVFFMESDNYIKVSLRSQGDFDVNIFARQYYKGGGHKNASGGKSYKSMQKALKDFEEIVKNLDFAEFQNG